MIIARLSAALSAFRQPHLVGYGAAMESVATHLRSRNLKAIVEADIWHDGPPSLIFHHLGYWQSECVKDWAAGL